MPEHYPCELHEQRLTTIEVAMKELAETTKRLEMLAARAVGGLSVLLLVQPIVSGLVLYYLTKK